MSSSVPVLLTAYRRPDLTRKVIDAIRGAAPERLYVALDGPNPALPGDAERVEATREVIEAGLSWPCEVHRLYQPINLGCSLGMSEAITWFFNQVEEGIVLEDDCLPHPDFFAYCADLLERYRDDTRVWCVSGTNFQNGIRRTPDSYYFSQYNHCWGWASWKRCWRYYDLSLRSWHDLDAAGWVEGLFDSTAEYAHWRKIWSDAARGNTNTWDIQWFHVCFMQGGLTAIPERSLIANIGFGPDATHTTSEHSGITVDPAAFLPLRHPDVIRRHVKADRYTTATTYLRSPAKPAGPFELLRRRLRLRHRFHRLLHSSF